MLLEVIVAGSALEVHRVGAERLLACRRAVPNRAVSSWPGQTAVRAGFLTCCSPPSMLGRVRATPGTLWIGEQP